MEFDFNVRLTRKQLSATGEVRLSRGQLKVIWATLATGLAALIWQLLG